MKEFEITVHVRNNRLKQRRVDAGLTQVEIAQRVGISRGAYVELEVMRRNPVDSHGHWIPTAITLANYYEVEPRELFPDAVKHIKTSTISRKVDVSDVEAILNPSRNHLLENPEAAFDATEVKRLILEALESLKSQEIITLEHHYGLNNKPPLNLSEIARLLDKSPSRVQQILSKALRKVRKYAYQSDLKYHHFE